MAGSASPAPSEEALDSFFSVMASELGHNPGNLRFLLEMTFEDIPFTDRSVLDITTGQGTASFYAACAGAAKVVSLDPDGAGSQSHTHQNFARLGELLPGRQVELRPEALPDFDPGGERFDVVIAMTSINHIDEDACIRLKHDPEARAAYLRVLTRFAELAAPGADLMVSDVSRYNLFAQLGIKNPIAPRIEWHKHQSPKLWAALLERVGFDSPRIRWKSFNSLRQPGRVLFGNRVAAYCSNSAFCLTMKRNAEPAPGRDG
jgi:SAM-dependent methyltransferase